MKHGICLLPVIPCRFEPSDRSEMVTQVLFGEAFELLEKEEKWVRIKLLADNYEGWIDAKQYEPLFADTFDELKKTQPIRTAELLGKVQENGQTWQVPLGSLLPFFEKGEFKIGSRTFSYTGRSTQTALSVVDAATLFLNTPYLWGGKTLMGIDCSGLMQIAFSAAGKTLPRDAAQQAEHGTSLDFIEEAGEGDLAFFDNEEGKIIHVGLILSEQRILHASGQVRIDRIDHQGIFHTQKQVYTHRLRVLKRF